MHGELSRYALLPTRADADAYRAHHGRIAAALRTLTPAARRLLVRLLDLMNASDGKPVNRPALARALGRPGSLCPHDRQLLERLAHAGLIRSRRQPLRPLPPDNLSRGSEYVYWIDDETAYILNRHRKAGHAVQQPESE